MNRKKDTFTDPEEAGQDFLTQGEYLGQMSGEGRWALRSLPRVMEGSR